MLILLYGNDPFLVNRRRRALEREFRAEYPEGETRIADFEDQSGPQAVQDAFSLTQSGLFAEPKCVSLLHPLSLREKSADLFLGLIKDFSEAASKGALLLCVQPGKWKKTDRIAKALLRLADRVEEFPVPVGIAWQRFAEEEWKRLGSHAKLSSASKEELLQATGGDTARTAAELEKLSLLKDEGEIAAEDVAALAGYVRENRLFQALDALGRSEKGRALLLFRAEQDKPEGAYPLLSMCAWQVRQFLLVRECFDQGLRRSADIAAKASLHPFAAEKALRIIQYFPLPRLKAALTRLSEYDGRIKRGALDPDVALELFVWSF